MPRLSKPIHELRSHYDVVVVGSGYGGGIAASRLSRAGRKVCVLERGREFQPGEYPDTEPEMIRELQVDTPQVRLGSRTGLYDVRMNDDINVFLGCGLGGTSLVNANVSLPAEPWVFEDPKFPAAFRQDVPTLLKQGFERAANMLGANPYPTTFPALPKLTALEESATAVPGTFYRPPINVTFKDGVNQAGVEQKACILCGDCVTGCNHHAKNTTLMNYLPDARNNGAEIFVEVGVRHLERKDGKWFVHYQPLETGREAFDAPTLFVTADMVVLSGGTLGSTEILLRSKAKGLALSGRLGHGFSGNGDVLAFSYNSDQPIDGIGFGNRDPQGRPPVGPCITGIIDERKVPPNETGMVIEEGSLPGPVSSFLTVPMAQAAAIIGEDTDTGVQDMIAERRRELESLAGGPYTGAMRNTQTYLVMTHDGAGGQLVLENDRLRIQWPGVGKQPIFTQVNDRLHAATRPIGGTFLRNPLWSKLTNHNLITVHPLGGCPMGETAAEGVVNHRGQVFSGGAGSDVHDGLYVADGSVIPRSLGVNPLLTISAVAERTCALIAKERGWQIDYTLPSHPPAGTDAPIKPGVRFTETMRGFWMPGAASFAEGAAQGKASGSTFEFTLTVVSNDLEAMLTNEDHDAKMVGTATVPGLSAQPMTVSHGLFNLFVTDPNRVSVRLMKYRMQLHSREGKTYYFEGLN
jgi:cholesterol oxidase